MLGVTIHVNGKEIDSVYIVNRGPIGGVYDDGDAPGGPGIRRYEWKSVAGLEGAVSHSRDEGAYVLVAKVMEAIKEKTK